MEYLPNGMHHLTPKHQRSPTASNHHHQHAAGGMTDEAFLSPLSQPDRDSGGVSLRDLEGIDTIPARRSPGKWGSTSATIGGDRPGSALSDTAAAGVAAGHRAGSYTGNYSGNYSGNSSVRGGQRTRPQTATSRQGKLRPGSHPRSSSRSMAELPELATRVHQDYQILDAPHAYQVYP